MGCTWSLFSCYICGITLRNRGFSLDLGGLQMHEISQNHNDNYFLIPLMGKVKGEHAHFSQIQD
jgi:hypothetical protein